MGRQVWVWATAILAASLLLTGAALAQKVVILGSPGTPSWNNDVQSKLLSTGFFTTVDIIDIASTTPTLGQLQQYNAALVYTDSPGVLNPTTFGDTLANYVDAGGGVVAAVFITASIPLGGRFNSANYYLIQPTGQQSGTTETMGTVYLPGDPLLAGVGSFNGGTSSYRPSTSSLNPVAIRVADWTGPGTIPLIVKGVINGRPRVDLGFFPPSIDARSDFWVSSTGGARIMANALIYVSGGVQTIPTLQPTALVLLSLLVIGAVVWRQRARGSI